MPDARQRAARRGIPTSDEMEEFFAGAEQWQQRIFIDKCVSSSPPPPPSSPVPPSHFSSPVFSLYPRGTSPVLAAGTTSIR